MNIFQTLILLKSACEMLVKKSCDSYKKTSEQMTCSSQ